MTITPPSLLIAMSGLKSLHHCHVAWSRNQVDKFIAISSDVKLFEFTNQPQSQAQQTSHLSNLQLGSNSLGRPNTNKSKHADHFMNSRLIATGPEISYFKAAACYPGSISDDDTLVAISCNGVQNTGKIVLVCLRPSAPYSIDNYTHTDLITKRCVCNDVDWSLVNNSLLATAWDRHKLDNSLQIFDINRNIDTGKYSFNFSVTSNNRPVFDGCAGDYINSLKWFRKEQSIACGINGKQIRIYDIRDFTKPKLTTQTRAVYGVTVDAFSDKRFASYADDRIYIWDSRFFDKPIVTIIESKAISQISWCPTRNHAFSALMSGDHFVKIYDIQQASLFSEDFDAKIVERLIHPFAASSSVTPSAAMTYDMNSSSNVITGQSPIVQKQITSYDWHPTVEYRMIAISNTRDVIALNVCDRITLNWSPICEIVWTKGKKILQCLDSRDEKYKSLDDISVNMRQRAMTNYGMFVEDGPHHQRGDDSDLIGLLRWVKLAKSLDVSNKLQSANKKLQDNKICNEILGVGTLIRSSGQQSPSRVEVKAIEWTNKHASSSCLVAPIKVQVYHSDIRSRALLLCDWIPDIDNISQTIPIIDYLEKEGNYIRAAAIAVFNMRLQRAIESLTIGAKKSDSNLSSVAMALSGYTGERTSVWREMCQSLKSQLKNPYMKAMFAFLTCESDSSFNEIIHDKDLILVDRVAFSLLYLPDDKLNIYLSDTMSALVDNGDLNGILLTGITDEGLCLLQRYIEISSDIQSVSLIVLHSLPSLICNDKRAQLWVECYRGMLDCWRLWHHRAQFDNLWYSNAANLAKPPTHVLINCNYCGNPINKSSQQQHQSQPQGQQTLQLQQTLTNYNSTTIQAAASIAAGTSSSSAQASPTTQQQSQYSIPAITSPGDLFSPSSVPVSMTDTSSALGSNCKKCSYAKCCLCLTQLGSNVITDQRTIQPATFSKGRRSGNETLNQAVDGQNSRRSTTSASSKTNPLSNWFSWCQTCRHGAHSAHLLSWFSENSECPVSGCECKCMNLDSRTKLDDTSHNTFKYKFH